MDLPTIQVQLESTYDEPPLSLFLKTYPFTTASPYIYAISGILLIQALSQLKNHLYRSFLSLPLFPTLPIPRTPFYLFLFSTFSTAALKVPLFQDTHL